MQESLKFHKLSSSQYDKKKILNEIDEDEFYYTDDTDIYLGTKKLNNEEPEELEDGGGINNPVYIKDGKPLPIVDSGRMVLAGTDYTFSDNSSNCVLIGGHNNTMTNVTSCNVVLGGTDNTLKDTNSSNAIIGGMYNEISTTFSDHSTTTDQNAILGGEYNVITSTNTSDHDQNVILGGSHNLIENSSNTAVVGGRYNSTTSGAYLVVGNGTSDTARSDILTVTSSIVRIYGQGGNLPLRVSDTSGDYIVGLGIGSSGVNRGLYCHTDSTWIVYRGSSNTYIPDSLVVGGHNSPIGTVIGNTASSISLSAGTNKNLTSISIPAGSWIIWGGSQVETPGDSYTYNLSINATSATGYNGGSRVFYANATYGRVNVTRNYSVTSTTTIYLVGLIQEYSTTVENAYLYATRIA